MSCFAGGSIRPKYENSKRHLNEFLNSRTRTQIKLSDRLIDQQLYKFIAYWRSLARLHDRGHDVAGTIDRLMSEMTVHRFRHMPVVERGRLIGVVSIGDLVKMHVADAEFEATAMRQYITTG
jgi:hypothetical protein